MATAKALPASIAPLVENLGATENTIGKSAASVIMYPDKVLKIAPITQQNRDCIQMLRWLTGKLPVPQILACEDVSDTNYLLMSRIPGQMACAPEYMADPVRLTRLLAEAMQALWAVDVSQCPCKQDLSRKLAIAEGYVARGECSMQDTEPDTYGPGGFRDPEHLLCWLKDNKPAEKQVLSHGDLCLPNVFFQNGTLSGFIDLDHCGTADAYQDIALCYRSLNHNFNGKYGHHPGYREHMLFDALGIQPDMELIRYYILLDELF